MDGLKTVPPKGGCDSTSDTPLFSGCHASLNVHLSNPQGTASASSKIEKRTKTLDGKSDDVGACPLKCAVPCCKRTGQRLYQTTFFPCPLEPHPSSRLWARAIGVRAILKNMYICEDHFQLEDDLECYLKYKYYPRGQQRFPRFKKGVVPWKFPKCRGTSPTPHRHRVPISKTEFYKRQKARANRASALRRKYAEKVLAKQTVTASESRNGLQLLNSKESSGVQKTNARTRPSPFDCRRGESDKRNSGTKKPKNTSGKGKQQGRNESGGDYFNMLNGDLSTLIARVQPAICSWDVSEVRLDSSQAGNTSAEIEGSEGSSPNTGETDLNEEASVGGVCETSYRASESPRNSSSKSKNSKTSRKRDSNTQRTSKFESELSSKSDEESEDEIYMTPSEDEMTGDQDTSDTDFNVSSEESSEDHEISKPARRSLRNRSQKNHRPDRYSPPTVLRSRAKKPTVRESQVVAAPQTTISSPKSGEKPQPGGEKHNSDSRVSSGSLGDVESRKTLDITNDSGRADENERVEPNQSSPIVSQRKPEEEGQTVSSHKKSHVENFLDKNVKHPGVIRAVSGDSSDSEFTGDTRDENHKTDEPTLPKPATSRPSVGKVTSTTVNFQENPKWRLRTTKFPVAGQQLKVDLSGTVAKVVCQESQTSYSYKRVVDARKPGNFNRKRGRQEKFLVVRDGDQNMASSEKLSPQISGLIANMRNTFASFLHTLEEMKCYVNNHHSEKPVDACLTEPCISGLIEELKKFPDLVELEMAHFAVKCEKFYDDEAEKTMKNSKKIRWCNSCQNAARFHCCFSAAYCSRICQTKDWGKHNRYCGQSRMLLDDPDLKLNPFMANRLKALEYSKPTIGASMSNLEELHQSIRRNVNGQRIISVKNQSKAVKRSSGSCLTNNSLTKVICPNYSVKSYLPATVASASRDSSAPANVLQYPEDENLPIKTEPMDMEAEQGIPRPSPVINRLPIKSSLVAVSSPNQQVRITIPPNLLAGLPSNVRPVVNALPVTNRIGQSNTTTVNPAPRITAVAVVPKSTNGSNTLILPKSTGSAVGSSPVTLRCRTVVLPSGETQYIPVDGQTWSFKPNSQLVVKHINQTSGTPVTVIKQATTSGSILITRPAKPAYSKFIPISPTTQTVNSTVASPQTVEAPEGPSPLASRLPKLTPVMPKLEPAAVRTLDSSELDKILSTDHLKEAFDMSYASNILRP